jgi:hypothetical protein
MRVQSSMNVTNQRIPYGVEIGEGPQTLECIIANGVVLRGELRGYGTRWYLAKMHIAHLKSK